jgi:hypothetical protein
LHSVLVTRLPVKGSTRTQYFVACALAVTLGVGGAADADAIARIKVNPNTITLCAMRFLPFWTGP